ncbi:TPA: hypothetical protein ACH3X1_004467 [Trebouxia sp. C0004]
MKGAAGFSDLLNVSVTAGSTVGLGIGIEGLGRKRFGSTTHPRKWLRVNEAGKLNYITVPMPYPSAIFIRDKALVVNVESMRLIICQDEVLVLSVPDTEHPSQPAFPTPDCPFVKDLVQRVSEQKQSFASDHNLHVDTSLPYELRALEAVLARGVKLLEIECADLEHKAHPALDKLTVRVSRKALYVVKDCKTMLNRLSTRVGKMKQVLEDILNDDQEMEDMYLGRRAELQLAAQQAEAEERAQAANDSDPQHLEQQPHTAPQQPGLAPKGTPLHAPAHEGPPAPSRTPKAATPRAAVGSHARFAEMPAAADVGEQDRLGLGSSKARLEKASSLPAAEADSTARIMASLSRAASLSHSPEASSSSSGAGPGPSSSKASFTSQRSGSPFTAKRDKSFLDVQRFLNDSLSKSASKGKSIAKQLQVMMRMSPSGSKRHRVKRMSTFSGQALPDQDDWDDLQTLKWAQTVDPHQSEECELLLETYSMQVDFLMSGLMVLKERIDATEALIAIDLDNRRNELVAFDLVLSIVTVAVAFVAMAGSIFGMNLYFNVQTTPPVAFWACATSIVVVGLAIMLIIMAFARHKRLLFIPKAQLAP